MNKKLQEKLFEVSTLFYKHYKSNLFYNKRGITMSSYFRNFSIPSDSVIKNIIIYGDNFRAKLSFFDNNEYYPIGLFSNGVNLEFSPLTILYGNNGSGKSTISNLIAKKMNISRSYVSRIETAALEKLRNKF